MNNCQHRTEKVNAWPVLDLRKAFDSIDHYILTEKLERYAVRGVANHLIKMYICNRKQFVPQKTTASDMLKLQQFSKVSQGSKLGPLLFLIYVNDITDLPGPQKMANYANDTNVIFTADNTTELRQFVNEYTTLLSDWLMTNKLQLNTTKTNYIIFREPNKRISVEYK